MPVIVVPAITPFALDLCRALKATGGQVRAFVHEPEQAEPLRELGVHTAIGGWLDVERLEAACAQVHTVIHLAGDPAGRSAKDEEEAFEVTSIAADAADVARLVVAVPEPRKSRASLETGLARFGSDRSFEVVLVSLTGTEDSDIEALIAADAR